MVAAGNGTLAAASGHRHLSVTGQVIISCCYLFGIVGNATAMFILGRNETLRNKKQTLMLRCLVWNDLLALVGSSVLMNLGLYLGGDVANSRWFCALRVFWRIFGLGSGGVATVMAVERFLALTRPFLYQQNITYTRIKVAIFTLWTVVIVLVCLPFTGFGLYYDSSNHNTTSTYVTKCIRYRNASHTKDVAYAYLILAFGLLMCICIVWCNLAVVHTLCQIGGVKNSARARRYTNRRSNGKHREHKHTTQEEVAFAKLMAIICIFFVICWLPQMITIVLAQMNPKQRTHLFFRVADGFIAMNFALDPYIYVLFRRRANSCRRSASKANNNCIACWNRKSHLSREATINTSTSLS